MYIKRNITVSDECFNTFAGFKNFLSHLGCELVDSDITSHDIETAIGSLIHDIVELEIKLSDLEDGYEDTWEDNNDD